MSALSDVFTSIANAIRTARGESSSTTYKPSNMPSAITPLKYLSTSTTATASDIISGKTIYNSSGSLLTGNVIKYIKGIYSKYPSFGVTAGWTGIANANDKYLIALDPKDNSIGCYSYDINYTSQLNTPAVSCQGNVNKSHGSIGKYAIFAGGRNSGSSGTHFNNVDAYDDSLTKTQATALPYTGCWGACIKHANYLVMGAFRYNYSSRNMCVVYNSNLTRTQLSNFSTARERAFTASVGKYIVFAGGSAGTSLISPASLEVYDDSLTKISISGTLSESKLSGAACLAGQHTGSPNNAIMIIGGGTNQNVTAPTNKIETISPNLTISTSSSTISLARSSCGTLQNFYGKFILVGGEATSGGTSYSNIDIIDANVTRQYMTSAGPSGRFECSAGIGEQFNGDGILCWWGRDWILSPTLSDIKVTS